MVTANESSGSRLSARKKRKLYPAVLELFSARDFHQVSIRDISKKSGISTTTIYRYFSSKEKLLFAILDEKLAELVGLVRLHIQGLESTKEMFRKLYWVTLNHYDSIPGLAVATMVTAPTHAWMEEGTYNRKDANKLIREIIAHGRACKEIDPAISDEQILDLYFMYCQRWIQRWCFHRKTKNLSDSVGLFFDVFWKTVSVPAQKN